jgi:chemotaxis signal transduction protein
MQLLSLHKGKTEATREAVTIALPDVALFLAIEDVAKIIPLPEVRLSGQRVLGLSEIDQQQVIVVDLQYPLYGRNQDLSSGYLILLHPHKGLQYGIATPALPMIQAIATARVEPWHHSDSSSGSDSSGVSDQQADILYQIATHQIAPHGKVTQLPGYWLDSHRMIQSVRQWAA